METQGPILIFFFYQSVIPFRLSIFRDFVGLFWLIWAIWGSSGSQSPCWFHLMGGGVSLGMASQCLWLGWREEFFGVRTQTYFLALAMPRCSSFPLSCPHVAGKNRTSQGGTFSCQNLLFWCFLVPAIPPWAKGVLGLVGKESVSPGPLLSGVILTPSLSFLPVLQASLVESVVPHLT